MATARKWSQVAIAMQSAIAATKTITAITKASPGVVSSTAHGYSNGDFVILTVQGMHQVDQRVFRVSGVATDSFSLEGEDTTNYDAFSSGTAQKLTFGTSITTATTLSSSGGGYSFIDVTTVHDNTQKQIPGLAEASKFEFDNIWDISDAGLIAMKSASDQQAQRAFKFTFGSGGQIMVFTGHVGANLLPGGAAQQLVTTKAAITMNGTPTYYSS